MRKIFPKYLSELSDTYEELIYDLQSNPNHIYKSKRITDRYIVGVEMMDDTATFLIFDDEKGREIFRTDLPLFQLLTLG